MIDNIFSGIDALCLKDADAKLFTTYGTGGKALFLVKPRSFCDFISLLNRLASENFPYTVLGKGSKILLSDKGYNGILVCTSYIKHLSFDGENLVADSGVSVGELLSFSVKHGLTGLEFLAGIPASVGGLVAMNAGAFNKNICDLINYSAIYFNGEVKKVYPSSLEYGYRKSFLKEGETLIFSSFKIKKDDPKNVEKRIKENLKKRSLLPKGRCCGSVFKNPVGYYAGRLIDSCGLKGTRVGGAEISKRHANFITVSSSAISADVFSLINLASDAVYKKFNVKLEKEVILLGDF